MLLTKRSLVTGLFLGLCIVGVLAEHEVDNRLTAEDLQTIDTVVRSRHAETGAAATAPSEGSAQLAHIRELVGKVYVAAPGLNAIPDGQPREPANVIHNGGGVCYDRSRLIEKVLRAEGYQTRHLALYRKQSRQSMWSVLTTRDTVSHAVTEVLTALGWLVIDPVTPWLAIDAAGRPVSALRIAHSHRGGSAIRWPESTSVPEFYSQNFLVIFGLYSRHGDFYPPFNSIPDVNYRELLFNVTER